MKYIISINKKSMMKKLLFSICIILCLCGCSAKPELISSDVSFTEEYGTLYNYSVKGGWTSTVDNINYFFSGNLTKEQIYNYINTTGKVVEKIEKIVGVSNNTYDIYVCNVMYNSRVDNNSLYTSYLDFESIEYVTAIANLILGNEMNYGVLYGFSVDIARQIEYEVPAGNITEAIELYDIEPTFFDLNYACFSPYYVEEDVIEQLKVIADAYYQFLVKQNKTDILNEYSAEKQREYLNQFLAKYDKAPYDNSELDNVSVYSGGNALRFIWENPDAKYYFELDYTPNEIETTVYGDEFINGDYQSLRKLMVGYEAQTNWLNKTFDQYGFESTQAKIVFTDDYYMNKATNGIYLPKEEVIHVYALYVVEHEYIHHMLKDVCEGWQEECLAYYLTEYPNSLERSYNLQENKSSDEYEIEVLQNETYMRAEDLLEHTMDWNSFEDLKYKYDFWTAANSTYHKLTDLSSGVAAKGSFAYFLVANFGEEKAIEALLYDTPEQTLGVSWKELRDSWEVSVKESFIWLK